MHLRSRGQEDPYYWPDLLKVETISLEFALMKHEEQPIILERSTFFSRTFLTFLPSLPFLFSYLLFIFAFFGLMYLLLHSLVERIYIDAHMYIYR